MVQEMRKCIVETQEHHNRQLECMQRERDAAILTVTQLEQEQNINSNCIPPGSIHANKKVQLATKRLLVDRNQLIPHNFSFSHVCSAPTVIVKRWPNARCVEGHPTARRSVSEKTGSRIRTNASGARRNQRTR